MAVVLPAPLGPKKPNTSPRSTLNVRSATATLSPKTLRRPRASIASVEASMCTTTMMKSEPCRLNLSQARMAHYTG